MGTHFFPTPKAQPVRWFRPVSAREIVDTFNTGIRKVFESAEAAHVDDALRETLATFVAGSETHAVLLEGAGPAMDGAVLGLRVVCNLARIETNAPFDTLAAALRAYLERAACELERSAGIDLTAVDEELRALEGHSGDLARRLAPQSSTRLRAARATPPKPPPRLPRRPPPSRALVAHEEPVVTVKTDADPLLLLASAEEEVPTVRTARPAARARAPFIGIAAGVALVVLVCGVWLGFVQHRPRTSATSATSPLREATPVSATPQTSAVPSVVAPPVVAAQSGSGTLVVSGPATHGFRVYVDGRLVGDAPQRVALPCGAHSLRIGSRGSTRQIDVPCGGELSLTR